MRKIFSFFGSGVGLLYSKITDALSCAGGVSRLLKSGHLSIVENATSMREKSKSLLATNIDLGLYHFYRGNISDAKTRFMLIGIVKPGIPDVHYNIGRCNLVLRRFEKAVRSFQKALSLDANHKESAYYLKKISSPESVTEVPENVIRQYFNYTSECFVEHWLVSKSYRGHEYVKSLVMNFLGDRLSDLRILDLGCGTGVCGQFLKMKGIGHHITGVDISRRMLDIARKCFVNGKQAYNELVCISLYDFLEKDDKKYDVIIMTEVLHYSGSLKEVLKVTSDSLEEEGILIALVREGSGYEYRFVKEGDFFCHSGHYIQKVVEGLGLNLVYINRCKIYGDRVDGLLFAISRDNTFGVV